MSLRKFSFGVFFATVFIVGAIAVSAQTAQVSGKVFMKDADGKPQPVEGITIDCYRTDIKGTCRSVKTDKDGLFVILGIPFGGKVIFGVSGPDIAPTVYPETPAGATTVEIEVTPGDGRVAAEEEVRQVAASAITGDLTEDQKKEQAEIEKKRKEIEARNAKTVANNDARERLVKEGEEAFKAKDYDTAITKFREGYELDPEFVGAAPGFLNNLAISLRQRGVITYNTAVQTKVKATIEEAKTKVAADFLESLSSALKAHGLAKDAPTTKVENPENNKKNLQMSEEIVKKTFEIMGQMKLNLLAYMGSDEDIATTVTVFKSASALMPKDADILSSLVFALYTAGDTQQSLNYADHFLKTTEPAHAQRVGVQDIYDQLTCTGAYTPDKKDKTTTCNALKPQPIN